MSWWNNEGNERGKGDMCRLILKTWNNYTQNAEEPESMKMQVRKKESQENTLSLFCFPLKFCLLPAHLSLHLQTSAAGNIYVYSCFVCPLNCSP